MAEAPQKPIIVRDTAKPDIFWQTVRVALLIGCGLLLGRYLPAYVVGVAMPGVDQVLIGLVGIVATYGVGLRKMIAEKRKLRTLAKHAPDDVAKLV